MPTSEVRQHHVLRRCESFQPVVPMFERNLQDLVKGLRDCKSDTDTQAFINKALSEIKEEVSSREIHLKAVALQKACYVRVGTGVVLGV